MTQNRSIRRWVWPLLILIGAIALSAALLWTAPQTSPEEKTRAIRVVQVMAFAPSTESISVEAQGTVVPARRLTVVPQVSGRIEDHHPALLPGGFIPKGSVLARVDAADYKVALIEKQAGAEQAIFEREVEQGRQVVASREWKLLEENLGESEVNRALVLREPHLRRTESLVRLATNEIARAQLDLERTTIMAPFNAVVLEENVEVGQVVDAGASICVLAGTDEFWVQATLPMDKLRHIKLPGPDSEGASAKVLLDIGGSSPAVWRGKVVRLLSDIEAAARMARVLVRVEDPLGLKEGANPVPLLLGSFVQVQIEAGTLQDVLVVPRAALRDGGQIWLVDANNELQLRDAETLWVRNDTALIQNVAREGEQLVLSDLKAPLPGMKVSPQLLSRSTGATNNPAAGQ